jgi:hypothetical protein
MQDTILTDSVIFTAVTVLLFALALILIVIIIDHKARIPGSLRHDLIHITGKRRDHPIWSYLVGGFLLTIIAAIAFQLGLSVLKKTPLGQKQESGLLQDLAQKRQLEHARHFHNSATSMALEGDKSVCFHCHGDFPHFEQPMIRTLLNMHTQFLGCMTCHANPEKVNEAALTLKWLNFSGIDVSGPHFGLNYDGDTGFLEPTDDLYSKIVPYLKQNDGSERLLEISEKDPVAIEFVRIQDQLQGQDRDLVKKSFHTNVAAKGRFCTKCHTEEEKSYIPFRELGFSKRRIGELTSLNIIGLVQKYKKFYMPEMMNQRIKPETMDTLLGPDIELPPQEKTESDKRSWWRTDVDPTQEQ